MDHQDVVLDGFAQGLVEFQLPQPGDLGERRVHHRLVGHRDNPGDPPGVRRQPLEPGQQHLGQPGGQVAALGLGGEQLLGEERVALGAGDDVGHDVGGQRLVGQRFDELARVGGPERVQVDAFDGGEPEQLGQQAAQRVAPVHVLLAVAAHDQQPLGPQPAEQEGQQVAGRGVGPVEILEQDHHRARLRRSRSAPPVPRRTTAADRDPARAGDAPSSPGRSRSSASVRPGAVPPRPGPAAGAARARGAGAPRRPPPGPPSCPAERALRRTEDKEDRLRGRRCSGR